MKLSKISEADKAALNKKWLKFKKKEIARLPKGEAFQVKPMLEKFCKKNGLEIE